MLISFPRNEKNSLEMDSLEDYLFSRMKGILRNERNEPGGSFQFSEMEGIHWK